MAGTGTQAKDWSSLYETFFANAERLTDEVDRLSADLEEAQTFSAKSCERLREMNALAVEFANHIRGLETNRENAEKIATAAGTSAANSLTANVQHASDLLCKRLDASTAAARQATESLRRVSFQTRFWVAACVAIAVVSMALGAYGMHRIQKDPTDRDVRLRDQGMLLNRMYTHATKKERATMDALYQRQFKEVAIEAARTQP